MIERAGRVPIEETEVFQQFVELADRVWRIVHQWSPLAIETVGKQLVCAIDQTGAYLVQGDARASEAEVLFSFMMARGSAREARYWIRRAGARGFMPTEQADDVIAALTGATRSLNGLIRDRRASVGNGFVRELRSSYTSDREDPFTTD